MQELPALRAIGCSLHLACVSGPDRGMVLPVESQGVLGRSIGLSDPFTEIIHLRFGVAGNHFLAGDESRVNRVTVFGRGIRLWNRRRLRVGSNTWQTRDRTGFKQWSPAKSSSQNRLMLTLRFAMPLLMVAGMLRFVSASSSTVIPVVFTVLVAALFAAGLALSRTLESRDPSSLILKVANSISVPKVESVPESVTVYAKPRCWQLLVMNTRQPIGVVGLHAHEHSLWIRAQLWVQGIDLPIAWARSIEELGTTVPQILASKPVAGPRWCDEISQLIQGKAGSELPELVEFDRLYGPRAPQDIRAGWERPCEGTAVGVRDPEGNTLSVNLQQDGPHVLIVGGTGSGKSEFLSTLLFGLATNYSPQDLRFLLIDYKGGAGLLGASKLPHAERLITDLDGSQTPWLLRVLTAEVRRRKTRLLELGFPELDQWRAASELDSGLPRPDPLLVVVADEVRVLADNSPGLLKQLALLGTQGRSLGIHLVVATQRPGGAVTSDMRAVLDLRIALRCSEATDSVDAIGTRDAADLPKRPGRALIRTDRGITEVQTAYLSNTDSWIKAFTAASSEMVIEQVLPSPLPSSVETSGQSKSDPTETMIGMFEDPETSQSAPLYWDGQTFALFFPPTLRHEALSFVLAVSEGFDKTILASTIDQTGTALDVSLGDVIRLLEDNLPQQSAVPPAQSTLFVIPEFNALLQHLQSSVGPERSQDFLTRLIATSHVPGYHLICIDSVPGAWANRFTWKVFRFSSSEQLNRPGTAAFLPSSVHSSGSNSEQFISGVPGRVVVSGAGGTIKHAQLVQSRTGGEPSEQIVFPRAATGKSARALIARRTDHGTHRPALQVICHDEAEVGSVTKQLGGKSCFESVQHVRPDQWMRIVPSPSTIFAAVEPSREVTRVLCAANGYRTIWPIASLPFASGCGFICFGAHFGTLVPGGATDGDG